MSDAILRIGLVGFGDIAVRAHLPALERNPRTSVVVGADQDAERLAVAPTGVRTTTDAASVLADPDVDAVVIATPPSATPALVLAALEAGKYVLAEKPLGRSVAATAEVRDAPGAAERLQIGLTYRHHPAVDRLRELIAAGAFGRPFLIQAAICDEPANPDVDPRGYARRLRSLERVPPVISDGVHACDRLNYLLGEAPVDVIGWSLCTDPAYPTANVNGGVLTYADGTVARLEVVWLTPLLPRSQFVVTGPKGLATLDPPTFGLTVELADGTTEILEPPGDKTEVCFALQLERFVDACLAGTAPVPGLDEAIASLELAERIAQAAGVARLVPA
ncbi:MAG: Gfo/Idh/MocA family oxidoreductase [Gaiellaceae bacterium MAG52_C11]|nr:Gfo/Idh/MocA family oxidoreductase [Candidatus Gaiellasilicea maunaloa]